METERKAKLIWRTIHPKCELIIFFCSLIWSPSSKSYHCSSDGSFPLSLHRDYRESCIPNESKSMTTMCKLGSNDRRRVWVRSGKWVVDPSKTLDLLAKFLEKYFKRFEWIGNFTQRYFVPSLPCLKSQLALLNIHMFPYNLESKPFVAHTGLYSLVQAIGGHSHFDVSLIALKAEIHHKKKIKQINLNWLYFD